MPIVLSCPEASMFERLCQGQLSAAEIESFAQHVEQCPRCAAAIVALPADSTLVEALQAKPTTLDRPEGDRVANLVARLKQLRPVPDSSEATAAFAPVAAPAAPVEEGTQEVYDFLAPPRGSGEIGWLGPNRILKVLGVGGMGVVFQAEDPALQRLVALKAMKPALAADAGARQRFLREARTAAAVKHDHVVTIYQVGEDRGVPFLAMEYLEGESLDNWLKRGRQPNLAQLLRMGREMALGLEAAHGRGLIHRDVKPGNIWLEMPKGRVKLLDFGLARGVGSDVQVTQSGAIVGTPAYMAPEQARGEKVDPRCDLFSLGCVLYRLATGAMPFKGGDTMSVLMSLAMDTPLSPLKVNAQLPPALGELIEKLLSKDPAGRPASAKAVVQALQTIERDTRQPASAERTVVRAASVRAPVVGAASVSARLPSPARSRLRLRWLVAASLLILLGGIAAAAIILRIKTPDGKTTEMRLPEGTTVEVDHEKDGPFVPKGAGPLDRFDPAKIPALERFADMPKQVVAVLGENRGGHGENVWSVALSPDGKLAASSSHSEFRLWDTATMRERAVLPGGVIGASDALAFAPDGKTLAAATKDGDSHFIRLWDMATGTPKEKGRLNHPSVVWCAAFSADSRHILTGASDKIVRLWDVQSHKELKRFEGHTDQINHVALSPDGHRALSGGDLGILHLWDVDTGKELRSLDSQGHECAGLAFSPDGKRALSCSNAGHAKLWDVETGKLLATHREIWAGCPVFTPDGRRALFGETMLKLLDLENGEVIRRFEGHTSPVRRVVLSSDGRRALSGGDDNTVRLWDVDSGKELLPRTGHTGPVLCCAFSPDGKALASSGKDSPLRLWDLTGAEPRERIIFPPRSGSGRRSVAFSPDARTLAASYYFSGWPYPLTLWDLSGTAPKLRTTLRSLSTRVAFAADGRLVGWEGKEVLLWNLSGDGLTEPTQLKWPIPRSDNLGIWGLSVSPDGKTLAFGWEDGNVEFWDVSGKEPKKQHNLKAHQLGGRVAFAPDGKTLATFGMDDSKVAAGMELAVKLWDLSAQPPKLLTRLGSEKFIEVNEYGHYANVQFAPDGKTLLTQNAAGHFILWDVATRKKLRQWQLPPRCSPFAFAPDGRHIAAGSYKGAIFILRLDLPPSKP